MIIELPVWGWIALPVLAILLSWWHWSWWKKRLQTAYRNGCIDGHNGEIEWARNMAVAEYRMQVDRRMHDAGREHVARQGTTPSRIHKARVGPARPRGSRNPE